MSGLRAKCPDCGTYTAVALGPEYECHACGRAFAAGLVRVPRAWGEGGEAMEEAARLPFPYPETVVVECDSLGEQTLVLASELPERPFVLGGCCCAHVGAVEGLAARYGRIAVVWLDAHGDLNTPESSPTGNPWGMPLRMLLDAGTVDPEDVVLIGARNLDPPEEEFIASSDLRVGEEGVQAALEGTDGVYVAFDCDSVEPDELAAFMPEPGGLTLAEVEELFGRLREHALVVGAGVTALLPEKRNIEPITRTLAALSL
ncbi:MAG: arginase family protein [Gaiellaceae bacterium]